MSRTAKRRARRTRRRLKNAEAAAGAGYCQHCDKLIWPTVEVAKERAESLKSQPGAHKPDLLDAYRCPAGSVWHIGHNYKLKWISLCIGEHR